MKEARNSCSPEVLMFLTGNKSDLEAEREVTEVEAQRFKKENDLLYFTETSAKSGDNVDRLFIDVAKFIFQKYKDRLHKMFDDEGSDQGSRSNSIDKKKIIRATNDGIPLQYSSANSPQKKVRKKKDSCSC